MHRFVALARAAALAAALMLVLAACGDDGGDAGDEDVTAYCDLVAELDEQESMPSDEQLTELEEAAPEEIAEEIGVAAAGIRDKGTQAFGDPEVNRAFEAIEAFEEETCPKSADDEGDGDDEDEEGPVAQEPDPDATRVDVVAKDFAFVVPATLTAGKTAFVMKNEGEEPHHMSLVRFKDDVTEEQARETIDAGEDVQPLFEEELGESIDAAPGETAVLNAELKPGLYGFACFVMGKDDVPHFFKGMYALTRVS